MLVSLDTGANAVMRACIVDTGANGVMRVCIVDTGANGVMRACSIRHWSQCCHACLYH